MRRLHLQEALGCLGEVVDYFRDYRQVSQRHLEEELAKVNHDLFLADICLEGSGKQERSFLDFVEIDSGSVLFVGDKNLDLADVDKERLA